MTNDEFRRSTFFYLSFVIFKKLPTFAKAFGVLPRPYLPCTHESLSYEKHETMVRERPHERPAAYQSIQYSHTCK